MLVWYTPRAIFIDLSEYFCRLYISSKKYKEKLLKPKTKRNLSESSHFALLAELNKAKEINWKTATKM